MKGSKVKIGYIGLGRRGKKILEDSLIYMTDIEICRVCDLSSARMENMAAFIKEKMGNDPVLTPSYKDVINDPELDAIFIMTGWRGRTAMAIEAMRAGKYVAVEVGCAENLDV